MSPDQHNRKASLQRELIDLRLATKSFFTPPRTRDSIRRRISEILSELFRLDPHAATYEKLGDPDY